MATSAVDDDLDGTSLDTRFGMEDVAMLVFILMLLKCQDLGDNKSRARIIVAKHLIIFFFIHLSMHCHVLKCFHFFFTHRVVGAVGVEDHSAACGALERLVASALASKALDVTCLVVSIRRSC